MDFESKLLVSLLGASPNLSEVDLRQAILEGLSLREAKLGGANLSRVRLRSADLRGADLSKADLREAKLGQANLRGAILFAALLGKSEVSEVRIDRSTSLRNLRFGDAHDEMNDGADTLRLGRFDRIVNWSNLRFLSEVPLFGVSYVALGLLFAAVHGVDVANRLGLQAVRSTLEEFSSWLAAISPKLEAIRADHPNAEKYLDDQLKAISETIRELVSATSVLLSQLPARLTLPDEAAWAFYSAVMLVLGTTVYKLFCPPSVKRFSQIEWVAQLRRPRLLYIADSLACGSPLKRWTHTALQL